MSLERSGNLPGFAVFVYPTVNFFLDESQMEQKRVKFFIFLKEQ